MGNLGTTFRRDFNPRYVKVKAKSITYSPANFSEMVFIKENFRCPISLQANIIMTSKMLRES